MKVSDLNEGIAKLAKNIWYGVDPEKLSADELKEEAIKAVNILYKKLAVTKSLGIRNDDDKLMVLDKNEFQQVKENLLKNLMNIVMKNKKQYIALNNKGIEEAIIGLFADAIKVSADDLELNPTRVGELIYKIGKKIF